MTLANKRTYSGLKASLMAPVLAVGLMATAPASAAGLTGMSTLADINVEAAGKIIQVAGGRREGRRSAERSARRYARGAGRRGRGLGRRAGRANRANRVYKHRRRARRDKRNAAIGLGIGILGAAILANRHYDRRPAYSAPARAYRGGGGYRAAKRKCARVYGEDYVWRSDLVYDAYGDARVCKFVRRAGY